jgi:glutamine synthetase
MHLSLSRGDTRLSESFLAGIMAKMRPLCAFGMANFDSYVRVCPDAVGLFVGWGTENRDLPVRKVSERHWEFRFLDSTANPYLFLAALLFAGTEGIREQTPLELKDCNIFVPRAPDERAKYKIVDDMPKSLRETVIALKSDGDFADWFGREMLQQYVSIKGSEVDGFTDMTEEDRRKKFLDYF